MCFLFFADEIQTLEEQFLCKFWWIWLQTAKNDTIVYHAISTVSSSVSLHMYQPTIIYAFQPHSYTRTEQRKSINPR